MKSSLAVLSLLALIALPTVGMAQGITIQDHYLDVPGLLPDVPEVEPPGGGGILEIPGADSVGFVVDRSCSMGWGTSSIEIPGLPSATPWQAAQYELNRAVEGLDGEAKFGVFLFNHSYSAWRTVLELADEANKTSATGWVSSQYATGGTTYTPAVTACINIGDGPPEVVMFLSDGAPNEGYSAVGSITAANGGRCIINTIAFGTGGSALQIMTDIAAQNGGECRVIP